MTKPRPRLNVPEPRVVAREGHTAYVQIGAGIYTAQAGGVRVYYCRACAWLTSKAARRLRGELGAPRRTIAEAMELDGTLAAERAARTARTEARYAARRLPRQEDRDELERLRAAHEAAVDILREMRHDT